jgi:glycosyltransferase involved in cell wall biosynthesis
MLSAKCITYGRVEFLEESLHSFLTQDYDGPKEMVIVNDYPLQKLIFDHPDVRIINLDYTFDNLGKKENFATEQCRGEIIMQWDDDDVAMPWHLKNVEKYFTDDVNILHWAVGVYYNEPSITDMTFIHKLADYGGRLLAHPPREEASWFYMWGGRGYHCSGAGTDTPDRMNVIQRHSGYIESLRQQNKIPTGDVYLQPHWKHDYEQKLKDFTNAR